MSLVLALAASVRPLWVPVAMLLRISVCHCVRVAASLCSSGAASCPAVFDGVVEVCPGVCGVSGLEHLADHFFCGIGVGDIVVGVTGVEELLEALAACGVEALSAHEEQLAGPIQRVVFAAPVAGGVVLGALAAPVNGPVRQAHDAGTGLRRFARRRPGGPMP